MSLPQFQALKENVDTVLSQMQSAWATFINPVINRPQNLSNILPDIELSIGSNTIQHNLGEPLQGWNVVRKSAAADIYDLQPVNPRPEQTLILVSDAVVTVSLEVF